MDLSDYKNLLIKLLPQGLAWPRQPNLTRDILLEAHAEELVRVESRTFDLLRESDPRTAIETLEDWERVAGLPDDCVISSTTTLQERRARLVQKLTSTGGQSPAFFYDLATELGYPVEIFEYRPFVAGYSEIGISEIDMPNSTVKIVVTDLPAIRYYWDINVLEPRVIWFRCGESEAGKDPLAKIDFADDLECVINKLQPAHAELIFAYEGA